MNAPWPGAAATRRILLASLCLAAPAAAPALLRAQNVHVERAHDADFSRYHTYCWGNQHSSDPLSLMRIREAAGRDLQARGWVEMTSAGSITVFVHQDEASELQLEAQYKAEDAPWGQGWDWKNWSPAWNAGFPQSRTGRATKYLVIDAFDSETHQLLFRATAAMGGGRGEAGGDHDPLVAQMLRPFPATGK